MNPDSIFRANKALKLAYYSHWVLRASDCSNPEVCS